MLDIDLKKLVNEMNKSGSDKQTDHNYCFAYQKFFKKMKSDTVNNILEIGITNTDPSNSSLHGWSSIFPSANVYGIDIAARKIFAKDNIKTFVADQSSIVDLSNFMQAINYEKLDVILDDGSHVFDHAVISFKYLINHLSNDGIYMIEDIAKSNNGWQQTVQDWDSYLSLQDHIGYEIIDTMPSRFDDDSIVIGIWKK